MNNTDPEVIPEIVDTHCHIQSSEKRTGENGEAVTRSLWEKAGYPTGDEIIGRAREKGVTKMICVGCDLPDSRLAVDFANDHSECWAAIGIHPHEAHHYVSAGTDDGLDAAKLDAFAALLADEKVVAIGECGLDNFYDHSPPADQEKILRFQLELARRHGKPLIFHVREAFDAFWPMFDECNGVVAPQGALQGVLHSFTDNQANLEQALSRGLYIGVNGISTFTKSAEQLEMYKKIPLSRLLLETDAPFLTPSPYRGNICEPYHTSVTADFLAKLRGETYEEIAAATSANARKLFRI